MIQTRTELRTEAIVLRAIDYGESDRIVTFCTADFGKIRGIAKGARRSRKRFANALEPFGFSFHGETLTVWP
jgi:DNA repair protein RecO (recombination protein O)